MSNKTLHEMEDEVWRDVFKRQLNALSDQVAETERKLEENTATTKRIDGSTTELVNILNSFKGAMQVLETIGKVFRPVAAFATFIAAATATWFTFKGK